MPGVNFFRAGTLLIPSGPPADPDRMHLHVICTNPDAAMQQIVVSISTYEPGDDPTCILLRGCHKSLTKPQSFVVYQYTRIRLHEQLLEGVRKAMFVPKLDMNGQDFLRICRGIEKSPRTPQTMKNAYRRMAAAENQARVEARSRDASKDRPDPTEEFLATE